MVINVAQLLKEPVGSTRIVDVSGDEELDVRGQVELVRTDRSILVRGRLSTEVETTCSRCACHITCDVTFDMEEEFFPSIDVITGLPIEVSEEDAFTIDEHHTLDLHEAVRQYALLSLPIKRLCRVDCGGLCPTCGHNLNEGACSCGQRTVDPRWAGLVQLLSVADAAGSAADSTNAARRKPERR